MRLNDEKVHTDWKDKNTNPYGSACLRYVELWTGMVEERITNGEELRKLHNSEYGHEGEGIVNPAILTLTTK